MTRAQNTSDTANIAGSQEKAPCQWLMIPGDAGSICTYSVHLLSLLVQSYDDEIASDAEWRRAGLQTVGIFSCREAKSLVSGSVVVLGRSSTAPKIFVSVV